VAIISARPAPSGSTAPSCDGAGNITRSLLGCLALAGPFYVIVSLIQALTRPGFSLSRDEWSLLAVGHLAGGSIGFACLIAACFVVARSYARRGAPRISILSRAVGVVFAVSFIGIASGASNAAINLAFTAAVIIASAWLTAVAVERYRRTRTEDGTR
jgi:hypothetical protein